MHVGIEVALLSGEGVTLVMRAVLVASLILIGAFFRALVGPGRTRGRIMLAGTVGGMSVGVLLRLSHFAVASRGRVGCLRVSWNGHRLERELVIRQTDSA